MPSLLEKWHALTLALGLFACGPAGRPSTASDVATDAIYVGKYWLYYEDGNDLVRARCRDDSRVHDRYNCSTDVRRVSARAFWTALEVKFGAELDRWDRDVNELYTLIDRVDRRLLMMASAVPHPVHPELVAAIESKATDLARQDIEIAALQEQIAKIKQALAVADDADLRAQLARYSEELGKVMDLRTKARDELSRLRQEYINANAGLLDPSEFEELQGRRRTLVEELRRSKAKIQTELDELVVLARAMKKVQDQWYVHDHPAVDPNRPATYVVVHEFGPIFDALDLAGRTFVGQNLGNSVRIDVARTGSIERLDCKIDLIPEARCRQIKVVARDPEHPQNFDLDLVNPAGLAMSFNRQSHTYSPPTLARLEPIRALGPTLELVPVCPMIVIGGGQVIRATKCQLILE